MQIQTKFLYQKQFSQLGCILRIFNCQMGNPGYYYVWNDK